MTNNHLPAALKEQGFNLNIHIPIVGGGGSAHTLAGWDKIVAAIQPANIYVWLNHFFGALLEADLGERLASAEGILHLPKQLFFGNLCMGSLASPPSCF